MTDLCLLFVQKLSTVCFASKHSSNFGGQRKHYFRLWSLEGPLLLFIFLMFIFHNIKFQSHTSIIGKETFCSKFSSKIKNVPIYVDYEIKCTYLGNNCLVGT